MERSFYKALIDFDFSQKAVLCSLIQWKGSVPRKDYPLMLVLEDGSTIGTIGGGTMEFGVVELANAVLNTGESIFKEFRLDHKSATGEGGICGGQTKVLVEVFSEEIQSFWKSVRLSEQHVDEKIVVTKVTSNIQVSSERYFINSGISSLPFPEPVKKTIQSARKQQRSRTLELGNESYLIHLIPPPVILHIFGGGHIAKAVARLAHIIELDVIVYDDRTDMANSDRFPTAKKIITDQHTDWLKMDLIKADDLVLVATRGHRLDHGLMRDLLKREIAYLGLMSSKAKWKILSKALREEGFTTDQIKAVHAPVGLDIAAETVPEIAVSIMAEIIRHVQTRKRSDKSLSFE